MQYRKLVASGPDISLLGYGCMRLPTKGAGVDKEEAFKQMKFAFDEGVNYFDTAYPYHGGKSEVILGEFIKNYDIREKLYIADKLPAFLVTKREHIEKYFNTQLQRLDTNYIDFYLMHMLSSLADWEKLKKFGILDFLSQKKENGEICYIGFSFHGRPEEFIKILEDYAWDFCQIQFNYLDINNQAGEQGLKKAYELGIGVSVMEPLRGGSLAAKAPDKVKKMLSHNEESLSPAYWALRFVMNYKEVSTVLSGMNNMDHIKENIKVATETLPNSLSENQLNVIDDIKKVYEELMRVPCTGCNYCMPCPLGVDIPSTFNDYNSKYFFGGGIMSKYQYVGRSVGFMGEKKSGANQCISCGKCTKHCPQNIDIPNKLKEAHKELDSVLLKYPLIIATKFLKK